MHWLVAYPFATVSSIAFYLLVLAIVLPSTRVATVPFFIHPIPPHQRYLFGFDTLRGFAAALVAMGHCWWATYPVFAATQLKAEFLAYGAKGVPIFAVLSGFLIYRSVIGSVSSIERLRAYAIRRFFRIYPVYAMSVVLCLLTGQYVGSDHTSPLSYFMSDVFMLNVLSWPAGFANPPTWSLYIEVAFYAFLPMMVLVVPRRLIVPVSLIGIAVMIAADYESRVFGLWKYFLVGIVAAEASPCVKSKMAWPLFALGVVLLVIDFQGVRFDWAARLGVGRLHMDGESIGLGIACGLILAALPSLSSIGTVLNAAPLRMIGVISYSVYITHFFYIKANFPEIHLFTQAGTEEMYKHFTTLPQAPAWYLPFLFFPGALFWGAVSFILIERPGMLFGAYLIGRGKQTAMVPSTAPAE
jgi:peptidoglycan/LPS O-acetylase OafA/YrhL